MPLISTFGSLSSKQSLAKTFVPISSNEWILQFTNDNGLGYSTPSSNGYVYKTANTTLAPTKIDSSATVIYSKFNNSNFSGNAIAIDIDENIIIGGRIAATGEPAICKFNSDGSLIWSAGILNAPSGTNEPYPTNGFNLNHIVVDSSNNIYGLYIAGSSNTVTGYTLAFIAKYNSNGTLLIQKRVLLESSVPRTMHIDSSNNLIVSGYDKVTGTTYQKQVIGSYTLNNLTATRSLFVQSLSTANISTQRFMKSSVSDDTHIYQIIFIGTDINIAKISKTTGAISYCYRYRFGLLGSLVSTSITTDNLGNFYLLGTAPGSLGGTNIFVGKFSMSTGACIWGKTILSNSGTGSPYGQTISTQTGQSINFLNNFLYFDFVFTTRLNSVDTNYSVSIKLSADGTILPGTYNFYKIANMVPTTVSTTLTTSVSTDTSTITNWYTQTPTMDIIDKPVTTTKITLS